MIEAFGLYAITYDPLMDLPVTTLHPVTWPLPFQPATTGEPPARYAGDNGNRPRAPWRKARNLARRMPDCSASDSPIWLRSEEAT